MSAAQTSYQISPAERELIRRNAERLLETIGLTPLKVRLLCRKYQPLPPLIPLNPQPSTLNLTVH